MAKLLANDALCELTDVIKETIKSIYTIIKETIAYIMLISNIELLISQIHYMTCMYLLPNSHQYNYI